MLRKEKLTKMIKMKFFVNGNKKYILGHHSSIKDSLSYLVRGAFMIQLTAKFSLEHVTQICF